MSMRYGFFDSEITGYDNEGMPIFDRAESSDFLALFIQKLVSDGVLADPATCFQVVADEGMKIKVKAGFGIIKGRFAYDSQDASFTLAEAPSSYKRIDRVVLRANYLDRTCEIIVKTGTAANSPTAPELIRPASGDYFELSLATILINSNQTVITQSNITDTRYDSSVCGVVTQVIDHIDTSVLYAQLTAFYSEFQGQCADDYTAYNSAMELYLAELESSGENQLQSIVDTLTLFESHSESDFDTWFDNIKGQLSDDAAGHLQNEVDDMTEEEFKRYYGLVDKVTDIVNGENGKTITAVGDGVTAVTTFSGTSAARTIQTIVTPEEGNYYYVYTAVITATSTGKHIVESYEQEPKGD